MQDGNQETAAKISERNGVLLDVARCPMTRQEIEDIINQMNPQKFSYLVLHLNDDEHVAFQSKLLGNVGAPNTLSVADMKAITQDAQNHHIMLVPDFDTPGHCEALLNLLNQHNPKLAQEIRMDKHTLDYTNSQTVKFVKEIDGELSQACSDQKYPYLMMGGDEVAGSGTHSKALMNYFNQLNGYENHQGFRTVMWNDSITKHNSLSDKIAIAYWAQGGANTARGLLQKYFDDRANVADLIHHPLINANEAYNYLNLSDLSDPTFVVDFIKQFNQNNPQNFNLIDNQNWTNDPNSYQKEVATDGQLVCLWGSKNQINMTQIIQFIKELNAPVSAKSSQVSKVDSLSDKNQSFSSSRASALPSLSSSSLSLRVSSQSSSLAEPQSSSSKKISSSGASGFQQSNPSSEISGDSLVGNDSQAVKASESSQPDSVSNQAVNNKNENNYNCPISEQAQNSKVQASSTVSNIISSSSLMTTNLNSSSSNIASMNNVVRKSTIKASLKKSRQVIPQTGEAPSSIAIGGIVLMLSLGIFIQNKKN